jgi:hypothetical protein
MATIGLLHGVHRQRANGVDAQEIELRGVRHESTSGQWSVISDQ